MGENADVVRRLVDRAVNGRDPSAVDDLVAEDYAGHGFPADREALRAFYAWQARTAPGVPLPEPRRRDLEWVAIYRVAAGRVAEVWVAVRDL